MGAAPVVGAGVAEAWVVRVHLVRRPVEKVGHRDGAAEARGAGSGIAVAVAAVVGIVLAGRHTLGGPGNQDTIVRHEMGARAASDAALAWARLGVDDVAYAAGDADGVASGNESDGHGPPCQTLPHLHEPFE